MLADTNFILRALDPGSQDHARKARKRLKACRASGERISVLAATIVETAYVLSSAPADYGYTAAETAEVISGLLEEPAFQIDQTEVFRRAADLHAEHGADFHDCYLAATALDSEQQVLSFDRDLKKLGVAVTP